MQFIDITTTKRIIKIKGQCVPQHLCAHMWLYYRDSNGNAISFNCVADAVDFLMED